MFDTIPQIVPDSVPLYLQREPMEVVDSTQEVLSGWWYEVIPTDSTGVGFAVDSVGASVQEGVEGMLLPLSNGVYSVFFLLFVVALGLIGLVLISGGGWIFGSLRRALTPTKERRKVYKPKVTVLAMWAVSGLMLQSLLVSTMVLYRLTDILAKEWVMVVHPALLFGGLFVALLSFVVLKATIYRVTDMVYPEWGFRRWLLRFYNLVGMAGVLLFVPALFFIFTPEWSVYALWVIAGVIVFMTFVVFINLLNIFVKSRIGLISYFLYLCAFEIIPLVLIYKGVTMIV